MVRATKISYKTKHIGHSMNTSIRILTDYSDLVELYELPFAP